MRSAKANVDLGNGLRESGDFVLFRLRGGSTIESNTIESKHSHSAITRRGGRGGGLTTNPPSASIADLLAASARGCGLGCSSMLIDLAKVRESEQPLLVEADFDERALRITEESLARLEGPAHAKLKVTVRGDAVRVTGRVQAELRVVCCRCASTFERPLEKAFDLDYAPDPAVKPDGEEVALSYSDLGVGFYHNDELDLRNVVAEQIFLDVPMKPLCREDCHGLCDQCGADLNQGECGCERKSSDPRLAPLLDLKRRMNERD